MINSMLGLRPLLLIAVSLIFVIIVNMYISLIKKTSYEKGVLDERARIELLIAVEDNKKREFEILLETTITEYGIKAVNEAASRIKKETIHTKTIETIIRDNPIYTECKADKDVIDNRNAIRALGPAEAKK